MFCFVANQVVCVTALVNNVPVPVPLPPIQPSLNFTADSAEAVRITAAGRRAHQLAGKHTYCAVLCIYARERMSSHKLHKCTPQCYISSLKDSLCRSVLSASLAPQQTVSADALHNNAQNSKDSGKRQLPSSACVFSLGSNVARLRTAVGIIQSSETRHIMRFKLTIVTVVSSSERLASATISYILKRFKAQPLPLPDVHHFITGNEKFPTQPCL